MENKVEIAIYEKYLILIKKYFIIVVLVGLSYWVFRLDNQLQQSHEKTVELQQHIIEVTEKNTEAWKAAYNKSYEAYLITIQSRRNDK